MTCKCPPSSPFLWRTYQSELNTKKMSQDAVMSGISTRHVNASRKAGVEPMALGPMSNKKLAHSTNPRAAHLQPTTRRKP